MADLWEREIDHPLIAWRTQHSADHRSPVPLVRCSGSRFSLAARASKTLRLLRSYRCTPVDGRDCAAGALLMSGAPPNNPLRGKRKKCARPYRNR